MNYVLLVWEEVPEDHKMYVIPCEVADKFISYLEKAHKNFVNTVGWEENEGLKFLNTALADYEGSVAEPGFEEHLGIFAQYKHTLDTPITGKVIEAVYLSGFLL